LRSLESWRKRSRRQVPAAEFADVVKGHAIHLFGTVLTQSDFFVVSGKFTSQIPLARDHSLG